LRAGRDVLNDDRPGGDERLLADVHSGQDDRADADQCPLADRDDASKPRAGRDVHVRAEAAVVLDDRARVEDDAVADLGCGVDDYTCEHLRAAPELRPRGHRSPSVNDRGQLEARGRQTLERSGTRSSVFDATDSHERMRYSLLTESFELSFAAEHRMAQKLTAGAGRVVVDQSGHFEPA